MKSLGEKHHNAGSITRVFCFGLCVLLYFLNFLLNVFLLILCPLSDAENACVPSQGPRKTQCPRLLATACPSHGSPRKLLDGEPLPLPQGLGGPKHLNSHPHPPQTFTPVLHPSSPTRWEATLRTGPRPDEHPTRFPPHPGLFPRLSPDTPWATPALAQAPPEKSHTAAVQYLAKARWAVLGISTSCASAAYRLAGIPLSCIPSQWPPPGRLPCVLRLSSGDMGRSPPWEATSPAQPLYCVTRDPFLPSVSASESSFLTTSCPAVRLSETHARERRRLSIPFLLCPHSQTTHSARHTLGRLERDPRAPHAWPPLPGRPAPSRPPHPCRYPSRSRRSPGTRLFPVLTNRRNSRHF